MAKRNNLYPHQKEGVRRALQEPFFALFMEQGTGKTAVAITAMVERFRRMGIHRVVVFAPNTLLYNWSVEIKEWARIPQSQVKVLRLRGKKKDWIEQLDQFRRYDPELCTREELKAQGLSGKKKDLVRDHKAPLMIMLINYEKARLLERQLRKMKLQSLIVDESQRVKSRNAQVSKAIYRLTQRCDTRLLMTGTPVGKGYEDLFMQYKIMDPTIFGEDYKDFENRYIQKGGYMGKEIVGYRNLEELSDIVAETSYRVEIEDCIDLPPMSFKYLTCELTGAAQKAYQELYEDLYTQIPLEASRRRLKAILRQNHIPYSSRESYLSLLIKAEPFLNVASCDLTITKLIRLHQLTGGFLKLDSGELVRLGSDKLTLAMDYLRERTRPTVVFCNFVEEIRLLEKELKKAFPQRRVENFRDSKHKDQLEADFKKGKIDILILQIHSGSIGLNFQTANAILLYSTNHSADDYWQAICRIRRPGQEHPMEVVSLLCEDTVDEDIAEGIRVKTGRMKALWKKS